MGHGAKDITDLHEAHEVRAFLAEDAERLRMRLGINPAPAERPALALVKGGA